MGQELSLIYDEEMGPVSGRCSGCGQLMPSPPSTLADSADRVLWLSGAFLDHKRISHSNRPSDDPSEEFQAGITEP